MRVMNFAKAANCFFGRLIRQLERFLVEFRRRTADEYFRRAENESAEERHRHAPVILHARAAERPLRA
jgi:hypothetical protein